MNRFVNFLILILLQLFILKSVCGYAGYKWVPLKKGDAIPSNAVLVENSTQYVGRARHFDEILPAEISDSGIAEISCCDKKFYKDQFDILVAKSGECQWKNFKTSDDIDESILHIGTAWNNEPIFMGIEGETKYKKREYSNYRDFGFRGYDEDNADNADYVASVVSIYLTKQEPNHWFQSYNDRKEKFYLSCDLNTKWIDSSAGQLPNNTVYGGLSKTGHETYIAQLKRGCSIYSGQAIPKLQTAYALSDNGNMIEAAYCQVLISEPLEYTWVSAKNGFIPDYAIVNGKYNFNLEYIARIDKTIRYLTHKEAADNKYEYDVLVMSYE